MTLLLLLSLTLPVATRSTPPPPPLKREAPPPKREVRCQDPLAYQIRLDRIGFSPGEIDGRGGQNLERAVAAFQEQHHIDATGHLNCDTLQALTEQAGPSLLIEYTITPKDADQPFLGHQPPAALPEQASLPALSYASLLEAIAERYHASPRLLTRLNPRAAFTAGAKLRVPDVTPFDSSVHPRPGREQVTVHVSRGQSILRVVGPNGELVMLAPVTSGSEHDPLPLGRWHVTGVAWMPSFHYNPELFWDASPADSKATIPPGPNNPVGIVWIDVNVPHYGLHGTPAPDAVGHAQSHGCVRLTNWDAARLAAIVRVGTPVAFEE